MNGFKKLLCLTAAAALAITSSVTAFADEPYESYNYDNWETAIPSQAGYTVQKTLTGADMNFARLTDPTDELYYAADVDESLIVNLPEEDTEDTEEDTDSEETEDTADSEDTEETADSDETEETEATAEDADEEDSEDEDSDDESSDDEDSEDDGTSEPAEYDYEKMANTSLSEAKDFYVYDDSEIWIADTGNNRILRLDSDYQLIGRYYDVEGLSSIDGLTGENGYSLFNEPQGLKVMISPTTGKLTLFVADYSNSRVVRATVDSSTHLTLEQEYVKPTEALYTSKTFNPTKVQVDNAENVYAIVKSVNTGSVQFKSDGSFTGFYGANKVEVTAKVIAQKLWRKIASNEQIEGMTRSVPVEYANFDMDDEGFIYTVTEVSTDTDAVKKVNPAGYNIWDDQKYQFGDYTDSVWDTATNKTYTTKLTDIAVDSDGIMNVLDYETGRVFQYDRLANLICIFGTTNSSADQRGSFSAPNAVETIQDTVIVLDGAKTRNDITVFEKTVFGENLHKAFEYFDAGLYVEAAPYWEEILKRDGGYTYAHIGLGKSDLKNHNYKSAMERFETAHDQDDYDKAFEYYREEWLQDHFTVIAIIVGALVVIWLVHKILKKLGIKIFKKKDAREKALLKKMKEDSSDV